MRLECWTAAGQTLVPNVFIDKYMAEANGEFVKVYLCLLRMQGAAEISAESLAERLDLSERTVDRALKYLEKCALLKLFYDGEGRMNGIRMLSGADVHDEPVPTSAPAENAASAAEESAPEKAEQAVKAVCGQPPEEAASPKGSPSASAEKAAKPARPSVKRKEAAAGPGADKASGTASAAAGNAGKAAPALPERRHYQPTEVGRLCDEDGEFNLLVSVVAPAYLDRTMTHRDNDIFAWLHHDMQLPVDVLEYCIEQCVERKKEDKAKPQFMHYIETVALRWHEEGVRDLDGARAAVRRFDERIRQQKEGAASVSGNAPRSGAEAAEGGDVPEKGRKKPGLGRSARIQAAYGFSTERGRDEVDYNALAWSRMWEEK